jgi:hypothetical protein
LGKGTLWTAVWAQGRRRKRRQSLHGLEYGSFDVIRTDKQGFVNAPPGNGLGIGIDWDAVKRATILNFEVRPGS